MFTSFANSFVLSPLQLPKRNDLIQFQNFFLTFTDALLCLFKEYRVTKSDAILMPNFYCPSTLKIISQHFSVHFYKINDDFSVDKEDYFSRITELKPRFILNYCFLGFRLDPEEIGRLKALCGEDTVIIEDYAHRIQGGQGQTFINRNHFYIDSCRKHSPFLGAHLVNPAFSLTPGSADRLNWYKIRLTFFQHCKNLLSFISVIFSSRFFFHLSERVFLWSDSLSGTSSRPTKGSLIDFLAYNFLSLAKIRAHKKAVTRHYNQTFSSLRNPLLKTLSPSVLPAAEPNYYPLLVAKKYHESLLKILHGNNIFAESLWDTEDIPNEYKHEMNLYLYDSLIIFPITWLISKKLIDRIGLIIEANFKPSF